MTTIEEVEKSLRNMRLHGMAQTLQARCLQAQRNRLAHPSFHFSSAGV